MNAVLWKVGPDFKARMGANAGKIKRLMVFKELDTNKEYKLNLPLDEGRRTTNWLNYSQEGNVFYGIQAQGKNPKNIDFYKGFTRVEVKNKYKEKV